MAARDFGEIYAIGAVNLTINAEMFINEATWDTPASVRLPSSGTYTGCAKVSTYELSITNPSSDSTFSFPVEYSENDIDWYTSQITGTVYKSLGATNISFTLVRTTIGESTWTLSGLCSSSLVNDYSYYKPNGSSPYKLGDFRWYCHGALGGTYVTYVKPASTVTWGVSYTVRALGSRRWVEISGKPYSTSRVALYEDSTLRSNTEVNFNTTHGAITSYNTAAETPVSQTNHQWYAKTQHYYGGSWVDGSTESFTVTQYGRPWTINIDSITRIGTILRLQYDCTENYSGASLLKFTATDSHGTVYEENAFATGSNITWDLTCAGDNNWDVSYTWSLQVYYNSTWYNYNVS